MSKVPARAPADDLDGQPVLVEQIARLHEPAHPLERGLVARRPAHHVGAVAGIALQPAQVQRPLIGHELAQMQRGLARLHAGTPAAHLHVHEDVQHLARAPQCARQLADVLRIVHHRQGLGIPVEHLEEAADLLRPHHLGGDEQIADARRRHHLGLAHLGHAHSHRARGDLPARDLRTLVGLGVRADLLAHRRHVGGHLLQIALEAIEIEEQRGRGKLGLCHGGENSTVAPAAGPGGCRPHARKTLLRMPPPDHAPISLAPGSLSTAPAPPRGRLLTHGDRRRRASTRLAYTPSMFPVTRSQVRSPTVRS